MLIHNPHPTLSDKNEYFYLFYLNACEFPHVGISRNSGQDRIFRPPAPQAGSESDFRFFFFGGGKLLLNKMPYARVALTFFSVGSLAILSKCHVCYAVLYDREKNVTPGRFWRNDCSLFNQRYSKIIFLSQVLAVPVIKIFSIIFYFTIKIRKMGNKNRISFIKNVFFFCWF